MINVNPAWSFSGEKNSHRIEFELTKEAPEFRALFLSDVHWDHPKCDRRLLRAVLKEAKAYGAPILDIGDFHCAMQGKEDKRSNKGALREEHKKNAYFDSLVNTAADWLKPYASLLTLRGYGNHETAILKHHETDLVDRVTEKLRAMGSPAMTGGFSGFVRFHVTFRKTVAKNINYWYHHGYGGGGPVTRDVIQSARRAVYLPDADIVHTGHTHDAWNLPIVRIKLSALGEITHSRQVHVKTAGFKEEYGAGEGGFHIERGGPPKPIGGAWLRIFEKRGELEFEITEAR